MKLRLLTVAAVLCHACVTSAQLPSATGPSVSDEDATKILEEIIKVQRDFAKTKKDLTASALERFKAGAATDQAAQDFYLAAYKVVNIDRRPTASKETQEQRDSGDWQKRAVDALGEGPVSTVLRMQLHLLAMTVEEATKKEEPMSAAVVEAVRSHAQAVAAFLAAAEAEMNDEAGKKPAAGAAKKSKRDEDAKAGDRAARDAQKKKGGILKLLRQPVMSTVFVEAYNLGAYMDLPERWPRSAADFVGAYEGGILPWYRSNKKADLPGVWDEFIRAETSVQQLVSSPDEFLRWGTREYKSLMWKKWLDLLANGVNATIAMQELSKIVRENPSHPDLKNWIADLARVSESLGGPKF